VAEFLERSQVVAISEASRAVRINGYRIRADPGLPTRCVHFHAHPLLLHIHALSCPDCVVIQVVSDAALQAATLATQAAGKFRVATHIRVSDLIS
jgi:hypothetical protein